MHDTMVTVVGNVATQVEYRESTTGGMARFRIAVTPRRWDKQANAWTNGRTSFYSVFAWRALAINLAGSVSVGEPLLVHGRLRVREEQRDGQRRTFVDIEALAVGHDLTRGTAAFRRGGRAMAPPTPAGAGALAGELVMAGGGRSTTGEPTGPGRFGISADTAGYASMSGSGGGPPKGAVVGVADGAGVSDLWGDAAAAGTGPLGTEPSWHRSLTEGEGPPGQPAETQRGTTGQEARIGFAAGSALLPTVAPTASAAAVDSAVEAPF